MTRQQYAIESMASDLKRVALGLERGSTTMAQRFFNEAMKRKNEIVEERLPKYIVKILNQTEEISLSTINTRTPEDCLMYAQILQNFAQN